MITSIRSPGCRSSSVARTPASSGPAGDEHQVDLAGGELDGELLADSAAGAGDECGVAGQIHGNSLAGWRPAARLPGEPSVRGDGDDERFSIQAAEVRQVSHRERCPGRRRSTLPPGRQRC